MIDVTVERVADEVGSGTIHGWNTGRLFKFDGALYFAANEVQTPENSGDVWGEKGLIFRRDLQAGGAWQQMAAIDPRVYTSCIDHLGRFWTVSPRHFNYVTLWRSEPGMDLDKWTRCYDGTCAYLGMGVDRDGNHLLIHAEDSNDMPRLPNAMISVFYDVATDSWRKSRIEMPEGRFGYVGIIVRGRRGVVLLQSTQLDPVVEPNEPHYNWRLIKLARCDDLMEGEWRVQPWLMRKFGQTKPSDMVEMPNGDLLVSYKHRGGDDSYEATQETPFASYISRIGPDLSVETFEPGIDAGSTRMFVGSDGRWYMVGRPTGAEALHLWRLDEADGFKPTADWPLPGTETLKSGVHTLRPDRFGGEGDGDTIYLVAGDRTLVPFNPAIDRFGISCARFDLPVDD